MSETVIVTIAPAAGTLLAESKDDARDLRTRVILPSLEEGKNVLLDFSRVGFATQSFVHALISEAIRRYGEDTFERVTFRGCSEEVQQVVLTVFEYTVAAAEAAGLDLN